MIRRRVSSTTLSIVALCLSATVTEAQTVSRSKGESKAETVTNQLKALDVVALAQPERRRPFSLMNGREVSTKGPEFALPMSGGSGLAVSGSGTLNRLTKWSGFSQSSSFIGDSTIFEDKYGKVGIGTDSPASRLTVVGVIESIGAGGFKFPDGTVQTTAGQSSIFHDATLIGNGTGGSPLGIALPLSLTASAPGVSLATFANSGEGGRGLLSSGSNGTSGPGSEGIRALGGGSNSDVGGDAIFALGGNSAGGQNGGKGVEAIGGNSTSGSGGHGVRGLGGSSDSFPGGDGLRGIGGNSNSGLGGPGVEADGGDSNNLSGGEGVVARGGQGSGNGNHGGDGVLAFAGPGVNGASSGLAGRFNGDVEVTGNLSKGGGSFKIDHPLDPENKFLYHSFVESPDMKNIYDGVVVTDSNGEAAVELPEYFDALNSDFRYQLTVIGSFAQAIVAEEIRANRFLVRTNAANVKVSWQVTGIRKDAWANQNRIKVEVDKSESERGRYLHPEAFNQPEERGIEWSRNPEMMRRTKERRGPER